MENSDSFQAVAEVDAATPPAPGAEEQKPNPPPEGEAPPETQQETTEQQEARKQSKFQRRLDRQKAARVAAETEARMLRERLEKLEAQSKPQEGSGEPKESDFKDYTEYTRALARWEGKQEAVKALKSEREAQAGKAKQEQAHAGQEKIAQQWVEREKSFQAATKDYESVIEAFTGEGGEMESLSTQARMAIAESEVGPALLYHLAKNPEEAERLADLSPVRQIAELGKMEAKVSMPAKKTTTAPPPASTTTGGRTATKRLEDMSQSEYEAYRSSGPDKARWAR